MSKEESKVMQNHMFDVAFSLESTNEWRDVTNGEMITALAKRLDSFRIELRHSREYKHDEAFGYHDSYVVDEWDRRSHMIGYKDSDDVGKELSGNYAKQRVQKWGTNE